MGDMKRKNKNFTIDVSYSITGSNFRRQVNNEEQ